MSFGDELESSYHHDPSQHLAAAAVLEEPYGKKQRITANGTVAAATSSQHHQSSTIVHHDDDLLNIPTVPPPDMNSILSALSSATGDPEDAINEGSGLEQTFQYPHQFVDLNPQDHSHPPNFFE